MVITSAIKPGRVADAIAQIQSTNSIFKRLGGPTGSLRLFSTVHGEDAFGGVRLMFDFASAAEHGRFWDALVTDPEWVEHTAAYLAPDSPWVTPARTEWFSPIV